MTPTADLIGEYLDHLKFVEDRSPRTIEARQDILTRADAALPHGLDQATAQEVAQWVHRDERSAWTKYTYFGALRSFYTWAAGKVLSHDPTSELKWPKRPAPSPRPVTDAQLALILTQAQEPYRLWATIAAYQGARCIEIARLRREDVTEQTTYLYGKGDKHRPVPTHPDVWAAVKDLPPGLVARGINERQISIRTAVYFRRDLGLELGLHKLRAWYLTRVVEACQDPNVARVLAGHASLNTTMAYLDVSGVRQRAAVAALPRLSLAPAAVPAADPAELPAHQ